MKKSTMKIFLKSLSNRVIPYTIAKESAQNPQNHKEKVSIKIKTKLIILPINSVTNELENNLRNHNIKINTKTSKTVKHLI